MVLPEATQYIEVFVKPEIEPPQLRDIYLALKTVTSVGRVMMMVDLRGIRLFGVTLNVYETPLAPAVVFAGVTVKAVIVL